MEELLHLLEFPKALSKYIHAEIVHPDCRHIAFQKGQIDRLYGHLQPVQKDGAQACPALNCGDH